MDDKVPIFTNCYLCGEVCCNCKACIDAKGAVNVCWPCCGRPRPKDPTARGGISLLPARGRDLAGRGRYDRALVNDRLYNPQQWQRRIERRIDYLLETGVLGHFITAELVAAGVERPLAIAEVIQGQERLIAATRKGNRCD